MVHTKVGSPLVSSIAKPVSLGSLECPRCGLSIALRPHRAAIRHCPRCVARGRLLVELFSPTLSLDEVHDASSLPHAELGPTRLTEIAA
jgi:hypothetical protein